METLVMPLPMMTMSVSEGRRAGVVLVRLGKGGESCQYEDVGLGIGMPGVEVVRCRRDWYCVLREERVLRMVVMVEGREEMVDMRAPIVMLRRELRYLGEVRR